MLKISFDQKYIYPLEENHRFPMIKYDLIPEQLLRENTCNQDNFFIPSKLDDYNALLTHDKDYYERFSSLELTKKELRPCLLYTSPSPRDLRRSRMPSSA